MDRRLDHVSHPQPGFRQAFAEGQELCVFELPGLRGGKSYDRVEDIAASYVARIIDRQPEGPIVIAAFCVGAFIALEMAAQTRALLNRDLDALLIPCGGGGLTSGCALAMSAVSANTKVYSVEPALFDDTARSLRSGQRERIDLTARTLCDSLMPAMPANCLNCAPRRSSGVQPRPSASE